LPRSGSRVRIPFPAPALSISDPRSRGGVAKWLRRRSAKPLSSGSNPLAASIFNPLAFAPPGVSRGGRVSWLVRERPGPSLHRRRGRLPDARYRALVGRAIELHRDGRATKAIARELKVPRSTVRYWLQQYAGVAQSAEAIGLKPIQCGFESLHQHQHPAYAYLLGMYLGDGYIFRMPRTYVLRIYLHENQRETADRVSRAIAMLLPESRVGRVRDHKGTACITLTCYFSRWPSLFPQHGPGRKHTRPIILEPWQREIIEHSPFAFLRGCLESDGCRHRRIVNGKDYPAYSFHNRSEDILRLFTESCERLSLHPCRASRVTISIARRPDVARLDALMAETAVP
jgi:Homeodomain-like domain-containing protein